MIELTNKNGASVWLTQTGAGIASVNVPDKNGNLADVTLGYKDEESYMLDDPCFGKIPGRFANRIAKGQFTIDGKTYQVTRNQGENHLHGGKFGFSNKKWDIVSATPSRAELSLVSPDGEEGYPGEVKVRAVYTWSDDNVLRLELFATTTAPTVINLTNHAYWNLKGEDSGSILDHELQIFGEKWLVTDSGLIPTGELADVAGTPMDFRQPKTIGQDFHQDFIALKNGKGYDSSWVLEAGDGLKKAAVLSEKTSGRVLSVYTTQPSVHVYTGNWLAGSRPSKSGRSYNDNDGVAIECHGFPDAPNHPDFPSAVLRPGEEFHRIIEFRFSTL